MHSGIKLEVHIYLNPQCRQDNRTVWKAQIIFSDTRNTFPLISRCSDTFGIFKSTVAAAKLEINILGYIRSEAVVEIFNRTLIISIITDDSHCSHNQLNSRQNVRCTALFPAKPPSYRMFTFWRLHISGTDMCYPSSKSWSKHLERSCLGAKINTFLLVPGDMLILRLPVPPNSLYAKPPLNFLTPKTYVVIAVGISSSHGNPR